MKRVLMHSLRCFFSRVGLLSKPRLLPWCATKPPGWSQLFKSSACKGNFTYMIAKKCQRGQKIYTHTHTHTHTHKMKCLNFFLRLAYVVTPLWRLSCEEQFKVKFEAQKKILQRLESYFQKLNGVNVTTSAPRAEGLCCLFHPIISSHIYLSSSRGHSYIPFIAVLFGFICPVVLLLPCLLQPVINGYQNKSTFSSAMESCFLFHEGGYWCELIFCTDSRGHTMAIITFHPQELRQTLKKFFTTGPGAVCDLTSLYFQESTMMHCSHQQSPYQLLFGEPHLFEDLLGLKMCISPEAFFQINNAGAEVLYRTVRELSVIGLSLVQYISQVLGINLVEQAVEDARWTAAFNGLCCPPDSAKKLFGESFVLRKAVPVDLFSHTLHCKLVLLLTCESASYGTAGSLLRLRFQ
ncbi:unnamed protein product [Nyctereutes procyonoides]|uniref:(raccoon dog) hypothetical protein n=1 Tax=Nyctereutes procyonoides TaxID=34880 RepID=A0A811Z136_NYCPR|nr:unnamed protein product [Nyctereutes procyonoides]